MLQRKAKNWIWIATPRRRMGSAVALLVGLTAFTFALPAKAHHPFGGTTPDNFWEALLSGLGHPVIGLDHLAFVVASGLVALQLPRSFFVPTAFVIATTVGTGIHLLAWDLPATEIAIAGSVLAFGLLLAFRNLGNDRHGFPAYSMVLTALAAIAGIFHGYAYGEAIIGAEMSPLLAYLLGFTLVQLAIASSAWKFGNMIIEKASTPAWGILRFLGWAIAAVGIVFLAAAVTA